WVVPVSLLSPRRSATRRIVFCEPDDSPAGNVLQVGSNPQCGQTMKLQSLLLRTSLFVSLTLLSLGAPRVGAQSNAQTTAAIQSPAIPARITQAIDETELVRLKGNVHPSARPEFDQGAVEDSHPMSRMLLLLQRSPEQEAALQQFMAEQQVKDSPNFHKWLTPQQFGAQFGPADADIQTVTNWLAQQ